MNWAEIIADKIVEKINGRKLAIRYREDEIEGVLINKYGIRPHLYISILQDRIDNIYTFDESYINKKSNEFFLLVSKDCSCSQEEIIRYNEMGFKENDDVLFVQHLISPIYDRVGMGIDIYGNSYNLKSKAKIDFVGWGGSIEIGKNCVLPKITIGSDTHVKIGDNCQILSDPIKLLLFSSLLIGNNVRIMGANIFINNYSSLKIGDNCTIQTGRIRTGYNASVVIGKDCMFSWNVVILPTSAHLIWNVKNGQPTNNLNENTVTVRIGDHCWLGGESVLAYGTDIGDGSIVGYRSYVNKIFPNNVVLVGSPAKVIKRDIAWSRGNHTENYEIDYNNIPKEFRRYTCGD